MIRAPETWVGALNNSTLPTGTWRAGTDSTTENIQSGALRIAGSSAAGGTRYLPSMVGVDGTLAGEFSLSHTTSLVFIPQIGCTLNTQAYGGYFNGVGFVLGNSAANVTITNSGLAVIGSSGFTYAAGTKYLFEFSKFGRDLRGWLWAKSAARPAKPQISVTLTGAQLAGLAANPVCAVGIDATTSGRSVDIFELSWRPGL